MQIGLFRKGANYAEIAAWSMVYLMWGMSFFGEFLTAAHIRIAAIDSIIGHSTAWFIVAFLGLLSINYSNKYIKKRDLVAWILYGMLFLLNSIMFDKNQAALEEYTIKSVLITFPYLFCGELIDIKRMFKPLSRVSMGVIAWYMFYSMIYMQNKVGTFSETGVTQNMHFAYLVLPHVIYCIWYSFTHSKDFLNHLFTALGIILLISYGNRGSFLDILVFVVCYVLFFVKTKRKYLIWIITIASAILIYIYLTEILLFLQILMEDLGMSTRIIDTIMEEQFMGGASVSERDLFKDILWQEVDGSPFWGYGICGSWQFIGTYPHDLILDMFISFGVFTGSLILLLLGVLSLKAFRACTNNEEKAFLLLLFITGIFKLFISYTYLDNIETFLYIGYCIRLIRQKKQIAT